MGADDQRDEERRRRRQARQATAPLAVVPANPTAPRSQQLGLLKSLMASAPVPSSAMVIPFGWSWSNGVSGCAVVTPEAIGYSKLSL